VINPDIPTVNTYAYFTATDTSAYCSGNVANMGVDSVTVRGFCWDTLPFPNLRNSHSVNGSDTGRFSGFVSGLLPGKCYYVRAYASNSAGTGYGEQVLVALYNTNPNPKFGITTYHNARFSPGNLQWNGADTVCNWRFASRQWETIGNASGNNTPDTSRRKTQNAWIDLFGWATSGYHDTADTLNVYYQPYDIEGASIGYGPSEYMPDRNLQGTSANYDWGVLNAISNPATNTIDSVGTWRTPTRDEWYYMFYSRQSATTVNGYSNARFTIAKVDTNINNGFYYDATTTIVAVIVFPDSAGVLNMFGSGSWGRINTYDYRSYTKCSNADWRMLEAAGCVLLPVGGARNVAQVTDQATNGYYWTASSNNNNSIQAHALLFSLTQTRATMGFSSIYRSYGYSVRMISDIIEPRPLVRTDPISDVTDTAVACGGTVLYMGADTIIERGICWDTVMYPTVNGNHVAMGAGMGAFSGSVYGMAQGTVYYVRAYATNSFGTAYGEPKRLKTGVTTPSPRFAVSANSDVRFSPGNLQWSATGGSGVAVTHVVRGGASQPGMWRFATRQWRTVGYYNRLIDTNYYGWTDLLGWGTSGYHNAADTNNVNYMPYSKDVQIQNPTVNLYGYGPSTSMPDTNLVGVSKSYDWGYYNSIYNTKTNSTDSAGTWRVPTQNEWDYLLNTRSVATTVGGTAARYTVAYIDTNATHEYAFDSIFSMCGMIIFPDSAGTLSMFGNGRWGTINGIAVATKCSYLDWKTLEAEGCVFLPAAGVRNGTSVSGLKTVGYYWSSTSDGLANANLLLYNNRMALTTFSVERYMGCSIRLVSDY
ncbi:MAG: hypothetical protein IK032_05175, partial [Bacteroidales bacterium]|nr:hypothetical protein [Bacteroidales bacterium]